MADAFGVDVRNRSQKLVGVELDEQIRHHLLHLEILLHHAIGSIGNEVHHNVQVDLIRLVTICVEGLSHLDTVGMVQHFQNLELSVLVALVLEHFLDGHSLSCLSNGRFENHSEGAISNNFLSVVSKALLITAKENG